MQSLFIEKYNKIGGKKKGKVDNMSITIKQLPESERPYEKLEMYGVKNLSNSELLGIIIKTGTKQATSVELAQQVLQLKGNSDAKNLRFLSEMSIEEFMQIKGIGKVKAIQLIAVCELANRMSRPINNLKVKIKNSKDVANLLMDELRGEKRELVKLLILNTKNSLLKIVDVALGGGNFAALEPKQVLVEPIKMQAQKIILVHNHPSGDPTPSKGDFQVTDRIYESADIMGITLLDHIIIGDGKFKSVFEK